MRERLLSMSLRTRIAALTAGAVAVAVLVVSVGAWVLVRRELRSQVDGGLIRRVTIARGPRAEESAEARPRGHFFGDPFGLDNAIQLVDSSGSVVIPASQTQALPVTKHDIEVADGTAPPYLHDVRVAGTHLRVLTAPVGPGRAVQMARALTEVDGTLRNFALVLTLLAALGVAGAAGAGLLVARRAVTPVERLTGAAEHVARTQQLSARIEESRTDELGRLAHSFNEMLEALETSREQQRRLVADASHELRTPLTSLRTNVEVLSRFGDMAAPERARVLDDLNGELEELTALVAELVDLATEQRGMEAEEKTDVRLDEIAAQAVERARRRTGREIALDATRSPVRGQPLALERAVANLIDNAIKWGPPAEPIEVSVDAGRVEVRDRGQGIPAEDAARVFDRFYRATSARSMPGSGLGLAIVKHVADVHGGQVWARSREGGGAVVGFDVGPADLSADS